MLVNIIKDSRNLQTLAEAVIVFSQPPPHSLGREKCFIATISKSRRIVLFSQFLLQFAFLLFVVWRRTTNQILVLLTFLRKQPRPMFPEAVFICYVYPPAITQQPTLSATSSYCVTRGGARHGPSSDSKEPPILTRTQDAPPRTIEKDTMLVNRCLQLSLATTCSNH